MPFSCTVLIHVFNYFTYFILFVYLLTFRHNGSSKVVFHLNCRFSVAMTTSRQTLVQNERNWKIRDDSNTSNATPTNWNHGFWRNFRQLPTRATKTRPTCKRKFRNTKLSRPKSPLTATPSWCWIIPAEK